MTTKVFIFALALTGLSKSLANINVADYVYWKKADVSAWHYYFPSRYLETEQQTNAEAYSASASVAATLVYSLTNIVKYQEQELATAQMMMDGTYAQGCLSGIAGVMDTAIANAVSTYQDCAADAQSKLQRLNRTLTKNNSYYQSVYESTLNGIENCAKIYPNKDSQTRLKSCVDSFNNNYVKVASGYVNSILSSPSMVIFTSTVVSCAETAAQSVVDKGWEFLRKLVQCSLLSGNSEWQTYENELTSGFNSTLSNINLAAQISTAQNNYVPLQTQLEEQMLAYYNLQRSALERYVIQSRGEGYYWREVTGQLSQYFYTVVATSLDNPANIECTSAASSALNEIVTSSSNKALQCDVAIVNNTKELIKDVNQDFMSLNLLIRPVGNPAVLSCFGEGYIFMEQTISKCSALSLANYSIAYSTTNTDIVKKVSTLTDYERVFYANSSLLPCGSTILPSAFLQAERALYELERCLYVNTGTKYFVTSSPI